jgi:hypothetical protein
MYSFPPIPPRGPPAILASFEMEQQLHCQSIGLTLNVGLHVGRLKERMAVVVKVTKIGGDIVGKVISENDASRKPIANARFRGTRVREDRTVAVEAVPDVRPNLLPLPEGGGRPQKQKANVSHTWIFSSRERLRGPEGCMHPRRPRQMLICASWTAPTAPYRPLASGSIPSTPSPSPPTHPPATDGHMIVVPKMHVASVHALPMAAQRGVWDLVGKVRGKLRTGLVPDGGFSIGFDEAGPHAAVHVVPRNADDAVEPPGALWVVDAAVLG